MTDIDPDEKVIFRGHPSWRSILGFYFLALVGVAVVVAVAVLLDASAGVVAALAIGGVALLAVVGLVKRIDTTYVVTDRRLWIRRGILSRSVQETRLERVQNVNTTQSFFQRLLSVGTVDFDTAGSDDYQFKFSGVADPEGISRAVDRAVREADVADGRRGALA